MKLIDLLVRELPKRGGWPNSVNSISQDDDGSLCLWNKLGAYNYQGYWKHPEGNGLDMYWCSEDSMQESRDRGDSLITKGQYEAALAASKQVAWDGRGMPPVGATCEHCPGGTTQTDWEVVTVLGISERPGGGFTDYWLRKEDRSSYIIGNPYRFRPIRSEAERKREVAISSMIINEPSATTCMLKNIYDAIAAGKIPGIKLAD